GALLPGSPRAAVSHGVHRMDAMAAQSGGPLEGPGGDPFADIPLFRELQRVLLSGSGPVNWELARQVGMAVSASAGEDPAPSEEDRRSLEDTVRAAELQVAEFTGLPQPPDVVRVEVLRRAQWIERGVQGLTDLVEPAAARMAE